MLNRRSSITRLRSYALAQLFEPCPDRHVFQESRQHRRAFVAHRCRPRFAALRSQYPLPGAAACRRPSLSPPPLLVPRVALLWRNHQCRSDCFRQARVAQPPSAVRPPLAPAQQPSDQPPLVLPAVRLARALPPVGSQSAEPTPSILVAAA